MFPDAFIAKCVTIGSAKMSYLVSYGLGPYFNQMTIREMAEGHSYFTLHFHEIVAAQMK